MKAGEFREFRAGSKPQRLADEFHEVLDSAHENDWSDQINCHEFPERYVDYEATPSKERAEWLCADCPVQALCRDYARATKPGWGVWGGEAWANGRRAGKPEEELVD